MKLRSQLFLVSLITLCLPWAGCQSIQEMESSLRKGQAEALLATAQAVAARLGETPELLNADSQRFVDARLQLFAPELSAAVIVDGYPDEWRVLPITAREFTGDDWGENQAKFSARVRSAFHEEFLYLFIEVNDEELQYHHLGHSDPSNGDHIILDTDEGRLFLRNSAPGQLRVLAEQDANENSIQGVWVETQHGYQVELQIPRRLSREHFAISVVDDGKQGKRELRQLASRSVNEKEQLPGAVVYPIEALNEALNTFQQGDLRLRVISKNRWQVADTGEIPSRSYSNGDAPHWLLRAVYSAALKGVTLPSRPEAASGSLAGQELEQALTGQAATAWYEDEQWQLGSAAAPIHYRNQAYEIIGAVVVERSNDALLSLTNSAFNRLLLISMSAVLLVGGGLLAYASWLSSRVRRLKEATRLASSNEGQVLELTANWPQAHTGDELDELSQHYRALLLRVQAYTDYLKTLANKLSHELRTPLAVVRSSLDNLEQETLAPQALTYTERAKSGAERLSRLLTAISEASRVESSIQGAECEHFPLDEVLNELAKAYSEIHPQNKIVSRIEPTDGDYLLFGSPDLIAQLLDKLVDNATDFCPPGGEILLKLSKHGQNLTLQVSNDGPLLPEFMQNQLFDSLVSVREAGGQEGTHMGLGLHIVDLVARFHGGQASAENRADQLGVCFTIKLPQGGPAGIQRLGPAGG